MLGASLAVAQRTDPGRDPNKQINEDAAGYHVTRLGHLLVVCDGMGGHALGQEASRLALGTIMQMVDGAPPGTPPGLALANAMAQAGRVVYQMGGVGLQPGRPGSTCVAVLIHAQGAEIAHVGDSRAYVVRRGQIWQLTKDHSVVQQMIDRGEITPEQGVGHPEGNKITRALGMKAETEVELRDPVFPHSEGDIFVLASDGLSDLVRADEIAATITRNENLEGACDELVGLANSRGGHDNITVQVARVLAPAPVQPAMGRPALAPTLIETPGPAPAMDKTLVDPGGPIVPLASPAPIPTAPIPTAPIPTAPIPTAPIPAALPGGAPSASAGPITHSGMPSRGGWIAIVLGLMLVALILVGVVVWWWFKSP
jgi:PPM family protein phosphatase